MKNKNKAIKEARTLLRSHEKAMLATHSFSKSGFPFGSVTTYMTDYQGNPIIYISHLAQHTKNIIENPMLSFLISQDNEHDINAGARLTLLGIAMPVDEIEVSGIADKFFKQYPDSQKYQGTHDFKFYRIQVEHVRYIGGFGQIYWLNVDDFLLPKPEWASNEKAAIDHMNEDHVDAMKVMCSYYKNFEADQITMTHLYPDGCVLKANEKNNYFLPYPELVHQSKDIRIQLVKMTQESRARLGQ